MNFFRRLRARLARLRPRRRAQRRADQVRGGQVRRGRNQALHRIRRPGLGPTPSARALIAEARARGAATAKSGAIDWWMFSTDLVLPYVLELRNRREIVLNEIRYRARNLERWDEAELHRNTMQAVRARLDLAQLQEQLARESEHVQAAWSEINRLARAEVERDWATGNQADAGDDIEEPGFGAEPGDADPDDLADQPAPPGPEATGGPAGDARWPGPHAPRIGALWTAVILLGLILVELPIQYVIFNHFELLDPEGEFLTWVFTIPVSAVMVLLPHLAGRLYRGRGETGSERLMRILPLVLLVPWAYLAAMLGYLRARVLLAPPFVPTSVSTRFLNNIPNNTKVLDITPTTITVMFIALILGVGGIGFLLGMAREHPVAAAYTGAEAAQRRVARQLQDVASAAQLAEDRVAASVEEPRRSERQLEDRLAAVGAIYSAAEQAYLDALTTSLGDPAISEAVARMVAQAEGQPPANLSRTG